MKRRGNKLIASIIAILMACTVFIVPGGTVYADIDENGTPWTEGVTGGAIYFDEDYGAISGCDPEVTEVVIPKEINGIKVTRIDGWAFRGCKSLESITIPYGVTSIGNAAFEYCYSLANVTIPGTVKSIDSYAFLYCKSLTSITIPDSVTSIGVAAFNECESLKKITVDENNKYYSSVDNVLFDKNQRKLIQYPIGDTRTKYTIPNSVTSIEEGAFSKSKSLTDIVIPNSVRSIGDGAFRYCSALTSITIPYGVQSIGAVTFNQCMDLTSLVIPDSVTTIGWYAISDCYNLTNITLPDSVTSIDDGAFSECVRLASITIPRSVTSIGEDVFYRCDSLSIYGYTDSSAEIYANENNIPFVYLDGMPELNKKVSVNYNPSDGQVNKSISIPYKDNYFVQDNQEYNMDLAKASLGACMASMTAEFDSDRVGISNGDANIKDMLYKSCGFYFYEPYNYEVSLSDKSDKVAFAIANKKVLIDGNPEDVMAVVIRSGEYGGEWASNGRVEDFDNILVHNGFNKAAKGVVSEVEKYMAEHGLDSSTTKVWVTGFSRGGAVANLTGKKLSDKGLVAEANLYCYTFATPKTTQVPSKTRGIFNTINPIDIVPGVPLKLWLYNHYGNTVYFPSKTNAAYSKYIKGVKDDFMNMTGQTYSPYNNHAFFVDSLLATLNTAVGGSELSYFLGYQKDVSEALAKYLGKVDGDVNFAKLLSLFGIDFFVKPGDDLFCIALVALCGKYPVTDIANNGMSSQAMKQHWPETYMAWLNAGVVYASKAKKAVKVKCPVDVTVYDADGQIVAQIIDNNALDFIEANPDIALDAYVDQNGEKHIVIPEDGQYRVEVTATDDGKMNYSVEEYNDEGDLCTKTNYQDIEIEKNDTFEDALTEEAELVQNETTVIEPTEVIEGDEFGAIQIETIAEGNGYVVGGGSYNSGDSIVLTAVSYDSTEFTGWYENGELISSEPVYGFIAENGVNRTITAKFMTTIKETDITLEKSNYSYTGKQVKPVPTVTVNGNELVKDTDYTVSYGTNKNPGYGTVKITGKGIYSGTVTKKFTIAKVTGLKVKSTGTNQIKLGWTKQPNVKGYKVYQLKNGKYKLIKTIKGSKYNYCTVKNLSSGKGYKFKVRTYVGTKPYYGEYSEVLSAPTKPGKVTLSKLTTGSSHYVKASWKKKTGTGYQVMIATNSKFTKGKSTYTVKSYKTTSKKITDLKKNKTYYVKVRAYKTYGNKTQYGSWSKYKKIKCK